MKIKTKNIGKQKGIALHNPSLEIKDLRAGITLIALVITIIVLLILAGVSIALLTGENGILTKASQASEQTKREGAIEKVNIAVTGSYGKNGKIDKTDLKNNLNQVEGIERITQDINSLPITVTVDGYKIIISESGKVDFTEGGEWTGTVNSPKLTSDMTPIYWDGSNNEVETNSLDTNWYNYSEKKWANAKTVDGSYWVWIPRYEYKIVSGEGTSTAGTINIKFISTDTTTPDSGYKIHPAFLNGTSNSFENGEWDQELSGIWVMKYEASSTDPTLPYGGSDTNTLGVLSKPGVPSWRSIKVGNMYTNSYNYDRNKDSHMIKNSEWGAVAYLTQSSFGRNGTEVAINNNDSYYTGGGEGDTYKTQTSQSTTGNITGVYDMNGGNWERVAAYITNGNENIENLGESFLNITKSTKYATVYPYDTTNDEFKKNYNEYKKYIDTRYGDAILEISEAGSGYTSWFGNYSVYMHTDHPFLARGGNKGDTTGAGIFAFSSTYGNISNNNGFRVCLAF